MLPCCLSEDKYFPKDNFSSMVISFLISCWGSSSSFPMSSPTCLSHSWGHLTPVYRKSPPGSGTNSDFCHLELKELRQISEWFCFRFLLPSMNYSSNNHVSSHAKVLEPIFSSHVTSWIIYLSMAYGTHVPLSLQLFFFFFLFLSSLIPGQSYQEVWTWHL